MKRKPFSTATLAWVAIFLLAATPAVAQQVTG
jgi:hypothetical protein